MSANVEEIKRQIDQFDLNIGNGLTLEINQNRPGKHCLFIGLGGTGMHALMRLKRLVSQKYFDYESSFVFLGIDSTNIATPPQNATYNYMALSPAERLVLSTVGIQGYFSSTTAKTDYIKAFLNDSVTHNGVEAGQKRQVGRTLLFRNIEKISLKLDDAITKLRSGGVSNGNIFIFSGVSGGTGSGLVLDIAYLLRQKLAGDNFDNIYGMLFMPDVNGSNPSLTNQNIRNDLYRNAYAAFKEIDYWMTIKERGDRFIAEYSMNDKVNVDERPFNYIFPIMATNMGAVAIADPYNLCISTAAEVVCNFASYEESGASLAAAFAATGSFDKVRAKYEEGYKENFAVFTNSFSYIGIGASVMRMPFSAFSTYALARILGKIKDKSQTLDPNVIKTDVERFIKAYDPNKKENESAGLAVSSVKSDIISKLGNKTDFNVRRPEPGDVGDDKKCEKYQAAMDVYIEEVSSKIDKAIEAERKDIGERLAGKDGQNGLLAKKFSDISTGIYYFGEFLGNQSYGLKTKFNDFEKEIEDNLERIDKNLLTDDKIIDYERQSYENAGFFFKSKAREYLIEKINIYYTSKRDKLIYEKMKQLYTDLQSDIFNKYAPVATAVIDLVTYMKEIMVRNDRIFEAPSNMSKVNADYSWNLYEYNEIPQLFEQEAGGAYVGELENRLQMSAKTLTERLFGEVYRRFSDSRLEDWSKCALTMQNFNIGKLLSEMLTDNEANGGLINVFTTKESSGSDVTSINKNMGYYIKQKSKGTDLKSFLEGNILKLYNNARVLYNKVSGESKDGQTTIAVYPEENSTIAVMSDEAGDGTFKKALLVCPEPHPSAEIGRAKDSIIFVTMIQGLALFESVPLIKNKDAYYKIKDKTEGQSVHLVSTNSYNAKKYLAKYYDWRDLPSFVPKNNLFDDDLINREQQDRELGLIFDDYVKRGLLRYDDNNKNSPMFVYTNFTINAFDADKTEYTINKKTYGDIVLDFLGKDQINEQTPISDVRAYGEKVKVLGEYLTGKKPVDASYKDTYGARLLHKEKRFLCTKQFDAENHKFDVGKAYFIISLNIQRDLEAASDFLKVVEAELERVNGITKVYDALTESIDFLVKAAVCGKFSMKSPIDVAFGDEIAANINKPFVITQIVKFLEKTGISDEMKEAVDNKYDDNCRSSGFESDDLAMLKNLLKKQQSNENPSETDSVATSIFTDKLSKYEGEIKPFIKSKVNV
jgi:hypothetical protein